MIGQTATALAVAAVLAAAWVGLTMQTGLTYHLAPGLIAAVPGYVLAWSTDRPLSRPTVFVAVLGGLALVGAGWTVLEFRDAMPTATFVDNQSGGVRGEMVVFALLGAGLATRAMLRAGRA